MATVLDELTILIGGDASKANKAIDALEKKLGQLEKVGKAVTKSISGAGSGLGGDLKSELDAIDGHEITPTIKVDKTAFISELEDSVVKIKVSPNKSFLKEELKKDTYKVKLSANKAELQSSISESTYNVNLVAGSVTVEGELGAIEVPVTVKATELVSEINKVLNKQSFDATVGVGESSTLNADVTAALSSASTLTVKADTEKLIADVKEALKSVPVTANTQTLIKKLNALEPNITFQGNLQPLKNQLEAAALEKDVVLTGVDETAEIEIKVVDDEWEQFKQLALKEQTVVLTADVRPFVDAVNTALDSVPVEKEVTVKSAGIQAKEEDDSTTIDVEANITKVVPPKKLPKLGLEINKTVLGASIKSAAPALAQTLASTIQERLSQANIDLGPATAETIAAIADNIKQAIEEGVQAATPTLPAATEASEESATPIILEPDLDKLQADIRARELNATVELTPIGDIALSFDTSEWLTQKASIESDGLEIPLKPTEGSAAALATAVSTALESVDVGEILDVSAVGKALATSLGNTEGLEVPVTAKVASVESPAKGLKVKLSPNKTFLTSEFGGIEQKIKVTPDVGVFQAALDAQSFALNNVSVGELEISTGEEAEPIVVPVTVSSTELTTAINAAIPEVTDSITVPVDADKLKADVKEATKGIKGNVKLTAKLTDWVGDIEKEQPTVTLSGDFTKIKTALKEADFKAPVTLEPTVTTEVKTDEAAPEIENQDVTITVKVDAAEWDSFKADTKTLPDLVLQPDLSDLVAKTAAVLKDLPATVDLQESDEPITIPVSVSPADFAKAVKTAAKGIDQPIKAHPTFTKKSIKEAVDDHIAIFTGIVNKPVFLASISNALEEAGPQNLEVNLTDIKEELEKLKSEVTLTGTVENIQNQLNEANLRAEVTTSAAETEEDITQNVTVNLTPSESSLTALKTAVDNVVRLDSSAFTAALVASIQSIEEPVVVPATISDLALPDESTAIPIAVKAKKKEFTDSFKNFDIKIKVNPNQTHLQAALKEQTYTVNLTAGTVEGVAEAVQPTTQEVSEAAPEELEVKLKVTEPVEIPLDIPAIANQIRAAALTINELELPVSPKAGEVEGLPETVRTVLVLDTDDATQLLNQLLETQREVPLRGDLEVIRKQLKDLTGEQRNIDFTVSDLNLPQASDVEESLSSINVTLTATIAPITEEDLELPDRIRLPKFKTIEPVVIPLAAVEIPILPPETPIPVDVDTKTAQERIELLSKEKIKIETEDVNAVVQASKIAPIKLIIDAEFFGQQIKSLEKLITLEVQPGAKVASVEGTAEAAADAPEASGLSGELAEVFQKVQSTLAAANETASQAQAAQREALKAANAQLEAEQDRISAMAESANKQTQVQAELQSALEAQESAAESSRRQVDALSDSLTEATDKLKQAEAEISKISEELLGTSAEKDTAQVDVSAANEQVEVLKAALAKLEKAKEAGEGDAASTQTALEGELQAAQDALREASTELKQLSKANTKLEKSLAKQEANAAKQAEKLQTTINSLNTELADVKSAAEGQTKALKDAEAEIKKLADSMPDETDKVAAETVQEVAPQVTAEAVEEVPAASKAEIKKATETLQSDIQNELTETARKFMQELADKAKIGTGAIEEFGQNAGKEIANEVDESLAKWVQLRVVQELEKTKAKKIDFSRIRNKIYKELGEQIEKAVDPADLGSLSSKKVKSGTVKSRASKFAPAAKDDLMQAALGSASNVMAGLEVGTDPEQAKALGKELGNKLIHGINEGTDSHSPSRKSINAMRNIADGLVKGKNRFSPNIAAQMRALGNEMIEDLRAGTRDVGSVVDELGTTINESLNRLAFDGLDVGEQITTINDLSVKIKEVGRVLDEVDEDFVSAGMDPKVFFDIGIAVKKTNQELQNLKVDKQSDEFKQLSREIKGTSLQYEKLEKAQRKSQKEQAVASAAQQQIEADKAAAKKAAISADLAEKTEKKKNAALEEQAKIKAKIKKLDKELAAAQKAVVLPGAGQKELDNLQKVIDKSNKARQQGKPTKSTEVQEAKKAAAEQKRIAEKARKEEFRRRSDAELEEKIKNKEIEKSLQQSLSRRTIDTKKYFENRKAQLREFIQTERVKQGQIDAEAIQSARERIQKLTQIEEGSGGLGDKVVPDQQQNLRGKRLNARALTGGIQAVAGLASGDITSLVFGLGNALPEIIEQFQDLKENFTDIKSLAGQVGKALPLAFLAAAAALVPFVIQLEGLQTKFAAVGLNFESEFGKIKTLAKDLKVDLAGLADLKIKIEASLIGTDSIIDSDEVVKDIASITRGFGLSKDEGQRFRLGVSQGFNKSTVSMEELRQQIGEAVPGFMSAMAEAMGMSTQQAMKEIAKGSVSSDFYADALDILQERTKAGVEKGTKTIGAAFIDLQNEITLLGQDSMSPLSAVVKGLISGLTELIKIVQVVGPTLAIAGAGSVLTGGIDKFSKSKGFAGGGKAVAAGFSSVSRTLNTPVKDLAKSMGILNTATLGIAAIVGSFQIYQALAERQHSDAAAAVKAYTDTLRTEKEKLEEKPQRERRNFAQGLVENPFGSDRLGTSGINNVLKNLTGGRGPQLTTYSDLNDQQRLKEIKEERDQLFKDFSEGRGLVLDVDADAIKATTAEMDALAKQIQTLDAKKLNIRIAGGSEEELKAVDTEISKIQKSMQEVSKKGFNFESVAALEDGIKASKEAIEAIDVEIEVEPNKEIVRTLEEKKKLLSANLENQKEQFNIIKRTEKQLKLNLDVVRAIAKFEQAKFDIEISENNVRTELDKIKGEFNKLPSEIGVLEAQINVDAARANLSALENKFNDLGVALNKNTKSAALAELAGVADLTTASMEDLIIAEGKLAGEDENLAKPMKELLDQAKEYKSTQKELSSQQKEFSSAILESKRANNELLNSLRDVLEVVAKIKNTFEGLKFELDLQNINAQIALESDFSKVDENFTGAKSDLEIKNQELVEQANLEYQQQLLSTVDALSVAEREILKTALRGASLANASYAQIANALSDIENQRARGGGVSENVVGALQSGLEARQLDQTIAQSRLAQAQAKRSKFEERRKRDEERAKEAESLAKEFKSMSKEFKKAAKDMAKSVRDMLEDMQDQIRDITRQTEDATRDFRSKRLEGKYKELLGRFYSGSPAESLIASIKTVSDGLTQSVRGEQDIQLDINKKIKNLEEKKQDFVDNFTDQLEGMQDKLEEANKKEQRLNINAGGLQGNESEDLLISEYNRLQGIWESGADITEREMTRMGLTWQAVTGSLEGLPEEIKGSVARFAAEDVARQAIAEEKVGLEAQMLKTTEEYNSSLKTINAEAKRYKDESKRLSNAAALKAAQETRNLILDFKNSMGDIVEAAEATARELNITVKRFEQSGNAFIRQGRGVGAGQQLREQKEDVEIQFQERQNEFLGIQGKFDSIVKSFTGGDNTEELKKEMLDLFKLVRIPTQQREELVKALDAAQGDISKLGEELKPLTDEISALRPEQGDLVKAMINLEKTFRENQAASIIKGRGIEGSAEADRFNNPFISGSFFGQAGGAQSELKLLQETEEERFVIWVKENKDALEALGKTAAEARDIFAEIDEVKMDNLKAQTQVLALEFSKLLTSGLSTLFTDLVSGTKSAGEAFRDFAAGIIQSVAQLASQLLAQAATFALLKALGVPLPQKTGGTTLFGFAEGGVVGSDGEQSQSLGAALTKEGAGAMVAVVHAGERMLSAKTGDAQVFNALETSGAWDLIKQNRGTFAAGGHAGSKVASAALAMGSSSTGSGTGDTYITLNESYPSITDNRSFQRSRNQRLAQRKGDLEAATRNNFSPSSR